MGVEINELDLSYNTPYGEGNSSIGSLAFVNGRKNVISTAESLGPGKNLRSQAFSAYLNHKPCRAKILDFNILDVSYKYPTGIGDTSLSSSIYVLNEKSIYSQAFVEPVHNNLESRAYRPYYNYLSSRAKVNESLLMDLSMSVLMPPIKKIALSCTKDTFTRQSKPKLNYGGFQTMVSGVAADGLYVSYVEFDISSLYSYTELMNILDISLNFVKTDDSESIINLYECYTDFQEYYVSWYSSLVISQTPFFTGTFSNRDVQIGIKKYILSMIEAGRTKFRFAIKSPDFVVFNTRESGSPPSIEMLYTDPNWAEGSVGTKDIVGQASIRVKSLDNIYSHAKVSYRSNKPSYALVRNGMSCRAQAVRTSIYCRCNPILAKEISSQVIVRKEGWVDVHSRADHNELYKPSSVIIPNSKNVYSQVLIIATTDMAEVYGSTYVNRPEIVSEVDVYKCKEVISSVIVRQISEKDLTSYGLTTNERKISFAEVFHPSNKPSQAFVWKEDDKDLYSEAFIKGRKDISGIVTPRYRKDIASQAIVSEMLSIGKPSQAFVSKGVLIGRGAAAKHTNKPSYASVWKTNIISSEVTVVKPGYKDIAGGMIVRHTEYQDIASSAFILARKDIESSVTTRLSTYNDKPSGAIVRVTDKSNVPSWVDVYNKCDLNSFVVVLQNKNLYSEGIARQFDVNDIGCRNIVYHGWHNNLLESQAYVRKIILDLPSKADVVTGARIWRPNHEGELIFEDRRLPRIWRRSEFIND
jgi:hypothetical protein